MDYETWLARAGAHKTCGDPDCIWPQHDKAPLACVARCAVCYQPVPGMPWRVNPALIRLDLHLHPLPHLGLCIGSRSIMPRNWEINCSDPTAPQARSA